MEQRSSSSGWAQGHYGGGVPSLSWIPVGEQGRAFQGARGCSGSSTVHRGLDSNHRPRGLLHQEKSTKWTLMLNGGRTGLEASKKVAHSREKAGLVSLKVISEPLLASEGSKLEPYELH